MLFKMKRKVILMGGKTHVISLPAAWIKKFGIKKSQELEVDEVDDCIKISSHKAKSLESVSKLDISEFKSKSLLYNFICSAYVSGVDEIKINFKTKEQGKIIREIADNLIGFAILSEIDSQIVIKDVTGLETDFEPMLKRIFFMIQSIVGGGYESIDKKDYTALQEFIDKDHKMNKYYFFCLRYLNKFGHGGSVKTMALYAFLNSIEAVGDKYAELYKTLCNQGKRLSPEFLKMLKDINHTFLDLLDLYYVKGQQEFFERINALKKRIPTYQLSLKEFLQKASRESIIGAYLLAVIEAINDSISNLVISSQAC